MTLYRRIQDGDSITRSFISRSPTALHVTLLRLVFRGGGIGGDDAIGGIRLTWWFRRAGRPAELDVVWSLRPGECGSWRLLRFPMRSNA